MMMKNLLTPTKRTTTPSSSSSTTPQQQQQQHSSSSFTNRTILPVSPIATEAEREQALRDYKVTIEYKHLKLHAPGGVYIVPSYDNSIRYFYGVIFIRRGPYMNGIFQFTLELPMKYNDYDTHPIITFTSPKRGGGVYSPYIDPQTQQLDIRTMYPKWDPARHYLVTILTSIKKIFYAKTYVDAIANIEAKELAQSNPTQFLQNIQQCVIASNQELFHHDDTDDNNNNTTTTTDTLSSSHSTLQFKEETICHRVFRDLLLSTKKDTSATTPVQQQQQQQQQQYDPNTISKPMILHCIDQASKSYDVSKTVVAADNVVVVPTK